MSKIEIFFRNKSTWSLLGVFILGGIEKVLPQLNGTLAVILQGILLMLTFYLQASSIQTAGSTGKLGTASIVPQRSANLAGQASPSPRG